MPKVGTWAPGRKWKRHRAMRDHGGIADVHVSAVSLSALSFVSQMGPLSPRPDTFSGTGVRRRVMDFRRWSSS